MTWEYRVEHVGYQTDYPKGPLEGLLNILGRDGWELTGVIPRLGRDTTDNEIKATFVFKRRGVSEDGK